ncbi:acyl carrier protein [Actinokineospora inagensis]|uniref:acyl carrier protein n=1 Tax=Actinokineospora inagensis TaxID=103730 RepID=UPI0003FD1A9D|nr:phosphopantetheine-binding protein [Actinokineospora inagensis]
MSGKEEVRAFVIDALVGLQYATPDVSGDTQLGPAGLDLESLSMAELTVQLEDRFGVKIDEDEIEQVSLMTIDEFVDNIAARLEPVAEGSVRE